MNKLNCCAYNIARPDNRGWLNRGTTKLLDANFNGIAKLRQRGFTWTQVHQVLERMDIFVNYNNLYQWQLSRFGKR
jgi:hypothetical protein